MTTITALPTPPSRTDPASFRSRADAFLDALPTFVTQANAVAGEVATAKDNAETAATTATTQAGVAAAQASAANASAAAAAASAAQAEIFGADYGVGWMFDSSTSMADPGNSEFRMNSATLSSVAQIAFNRYDTAMRTVRPYVLTWDDSDASVKGVLVMRQVNNPAFFAVFQVSGSVVDNTTWAQVPVTYVTGQGAASLTSDPVIVSFNRTGNNGATGSTGPQGPQGPAGSDASVNNANVLAAIGYTPYNATNPGGYITSAALTPYAPLASPTFTGTVTTAALTGADSTASRFMLKDTGYSYFNSNTTNALDYTNGSVQRWAPTAASNPTLSITNWPPTGNLGELLIEAVNVGAAGTVTYPTANWVKSDGTFAASPSAAGVTMQSSGTDFILLWTRDAGTTIYAKVIR